MKKYLVFILSITILSCSNLIYAQNERFFTLGVKAGFNFTTLSGINHNNYPGKTKMEVEFTGGITTDFSISRQWSILSGLEYMSKDADTKMESGELTATIPYYNSKYLQLPIHAGYKLWINGDSKVVFHAGPYFAYGIGGEIKWKDKDSQLYRYIDFFDEKLFNRFDFGIGIGATIDTKNFAFNVGYDHGLKNITKSSFYFPDRTDIDTEGISIHTRAIHVTIGWKFRQLSL